MLTFKSPIRFQSNFKHSSKLFLKPIRIFSFLNQLASAPSSHTQKKEKTIKVSHLVVPIYYNLTRANLGCTSCTRVRRPRPWYRPSVSFSRRRCKTDGRRVVCSTRTEWWIGSMWPRHRTWTPHSLPSTCTPQFPSTTRRADCIRRFCPWSVLWRCVYIF